jgi:hypothetical protein
MVKLRETVSSSVKLEEIITWTNKQVGLEEERVQHMAFLQRAKRCYVFMSADSYGYGGIL